MGVISEPFRPPTVFVTGTRVFSLFLRTAAAADIYTILSDELPFPATAVSWVYASSTSLLLMEIATHTWGFIQSQDAIYQDEATQISVPQRRHEGTVPPDAPGDLIGFPLPPTQNTFVGPFPMAHEVPGPGWRLFLRTRIQAAAFERVSLIVTLNTHTLGAGDGVVPIRPRGSPDAPFCVPVCIVSGDPGLGGPDPPPPGPPPPPPPPAEPDILEPPLPDPADLEPQAPLALASRICAGVR